MHKAAVGGCEIKIVGTLHRHGAGLVKERTLFGVACRHGQRYGCVHAFALFKTVSRNIMMVANLREVLAIGVITHKSHGFNRKRGPQALKGGCHIMPRAAAIVGGGQHGGDGFLRRPEIDLDIAVNTPRTGAKYAAAGGHYFNTGSVISISLVKGKSGLSLVLAR